MPNVGEHWKFVNADVDFTITRIEGDRVYYVMNWPEHAQQPRIQYEYMYDGLGRAFVQTVVTNPMMECNTSLDNFFNGTLVRSQNA